MNKPKPAPKKSMNKVVWQQHHGFDDEDMDRIVHAKKPHKADKPYPGEIISVDKKDAK